MTDEAIPMTGGRLSNGEEKNDNSQGEGYLTGERERRKRENIFDQ